MSTANLFLLLLICNSVFCQLRKDTIRFNTLQKQLTVSQDEQSFVQYLIVEDLQQAVVDSIIIGKEYDLFKLYEYSEGNRFYAIIGGRYSFFVFDGMDQSLAGPYKACCRVEQEDAQTGMIHAYKIVQQGKYMLVNTIDNGLSCFDIIDIHNIRELSFYKSDSVYNTGRYVFLDKKKNGICNMFSAEGGNFNPVIEYTPLLDGIALKQDSNGNIVTKSSQTNTLILYRATSDSLYKEVKIDLEKGVLTTHQADD